MRSYFYINKDMTTTYIYTLSLHDALPIYQWGGPTFYKKADDRDHRGKLIPSCFRVFESPESSYSAHSHFLLDPSKSLLYDPLLVWVKPISGHGGWGFRKGVHAADRDSASP